jgi:hypothetical protein
MKVYCGFNEGGTASSSHLVVVRDEWGQRLLAHRMRHSPTGFSWGYAGSGPADLARSILWDYLGAEPRPRCYQDFKSQFIAGLAQDESWQLSGDVIRIWLGLWATEKGETPEITFVCPRCQRVNRTERANKESMCEVCGENTWGTVQRPDGHER